VFSCAAKSSVDIIFIVISRIRINNMSSPRQIKCALLAVVLAATAPSNFRSSSTTGRSSGLLVQGYPLEMDFTLLNRDQTPRVLQTSGGVRSA
jgi:hypothetical protein